MGKLRAIDLATNMAIIGAVEAGGKTKSEIAKEYNLPPSTLNHFDQAVVCNIQDEGSNQTLHVSCPSRYRDKLHSTFNVNNYIDCFSYITTISLQH